MFCDFVLKIVRGEYQYHHLYNKLKRRQTISTDFRLLFRAMPEDQTWTELVEMAAVHAVRNQEHFHTYCRCSSCASFQQYLRSSNFFRVESSCFCL